MKHSIWLATGIILCASLTGCGNQGSVNTAAGIVDTPHTNRSAIDTQSKSINTSTASNNAERTSLTINGANHSTNVQSTSIDPQGTSIDPQSTTTTTTKNVPTRNPPVQIVQISDTVTPAPIILSVGSHGPNVEYLEELLAATGYLPLIWNPTQTSDANATAHTVLSDFNSSSPFPPGSWHWKYTHTPTPLKQLWSPTKYTVLTKSAVMTFEQVHHLVVDGVAGPHVFAALAADVQAHRHSPYGFSFVQVSLSLPQSLTLWHDGKVVLTSRANGGIPQSPTVKGTYPVYLQFRTQTMSGTNPSGTHYSDPGVPYVSYFYGGEAVHGFVRSRYGSPQSLGCVELPTSAAKVIWPYMHLGTLVHVS